MSLQRPGFEVGGVRFALRWKVDGPELDPADERWLPACMFVASFRDGRVDVPAAIRARERLIHRYPDTYAEPIAADRYRVGAARDSGPRIWKDLELELSAEALTELWSRFVAERRAARWPWLLRAPPAWPAPAPEEEARARAWDRAWSVVEGSVGQPGWEEARDRVRAELAGALDGDPAIEAALTRWGLEALLRLRRGRTGTAPPRTLADLDRLECQWPWVLRPKPVSDEPAPGERERATALARAVEIVWPDLGTRTPWGREEVFGEAGPVVCAPDARRWTEAWALGPLLQLRTAWERGAAWFEGPERRAAGLPPVDVSGLFGWPLAVELFDDPPPAALLLEAERVLGHWRVGSEPWGTIRSSGVRVDWRREGERLLGYAVAPSSLQPEYGGEGG